MKTLLMLGGGFLQKFVILKAKQLGYCVHVLDANPNAVGFSYADEYAVINIVDEEACLAYARVHNLDGVLTAATDFGVLTMSRIAEELCLPGINYKTAKIIKNKAEVRRILFDTHTDDSGCFYDIRSIMQAEQIRNIVNYPVMVKPCDGSGSRGASRVDVAEDFVIACESAIESSISHRAIVESFIVGTEYGVESFVENGVIHILAILQKDMTKPPYYAELGHAIPSGLNIDLENKVKDYVRKTIIVLGINHGSVNMDLLITEKGDIHVIDIGARMGGNLIGSHIIPLGTGIDYMGNMIKAAVGDATDFSMSSRGSAVATKLLALTQGIVKELPNIEKIASNNNVLVEHHLAIGEQINEYHTNLDGWGYVVVTDDNVGNAIDRALKVKNVIDISIVRE